MQSEILVTSATRPEYQRSAVVPLRWGSPRVLCLDRGVEATLGEDLTEEPFRAARLWRYQFDPKCDLVVSPYRPTMKFGRATAKTRDFLVAGLSRRIDFVRINPGGSCGRFSAMRWTPDDRAEFARATRTLQVGGSWASRGSTFDLRSL